MRVDDLIRDFASLEADGPEGSKLTPRKLAELWYVAGILYEEHQAPIIPDHVYDGLSRWLLENLAAVHDDGADLLSAEDLKAGTAMNWRTFPEPYRVSAQAIAAPRPEPEPAPAAETTMGAAVVLKQMAYHGLSVLAPTSETRVPLGAKWCARDARGRLMGFGASPAAAVEDALKIDTRVPTSPAEEEMEDFLK